MIFNKINGNYKNVFIYIAFIHDVALSLDETPTIVIERTIATILSKSYEGLKNNKLTAFFLSFPVTIFFYKSYLI